MAQHLCAKRSAWERIGSAAKLCPGAAPPLSAGTAIGETAERRPWVEYGGRVDAKRLAAAQPWLDRLADRVQPTVRRLLGGRLHDLLDGTWLGAPLHPALTDVPVGSWSAAFVLDAAAGLTRSSTLARAADAALLVGVLGAAPTALTGAADWRDLTGEDRRLATLHGVLNVVGLGFAVASLGRRARGHRGSGRLLSATGLAFSGLAAHLGGELSFGLGVRVDHGRLVARSAPDEFTAVLQESDLADGAMAVVRVDGFPVLVTRDRSGTLRAIADTCSHAGGPLHAGERDGDVVTCPWHGSRIDLCSGAVVEGPAVFGQFVYQVRARNGTIEVRRMPPDAAPEPPTGTDAHPATDAAAATVTDAGSKHDTDGGGPSADAGGPGEPTSEPPGFERDIRPLFRRKDVEAMKQAFDLSSYQSVRDHADGIHQRLADGSMPCDGRWAADQVQLFHAWMTAGFPR